MLRTAAAGLAAALLIPAVAPADGDPASDVLLGQSAFYPYSPAVSVGLQKRLSTELAAAARAHFPLKVAIIASPVDLGAVPDLFGRPQQYAAFLDQEISFTIKQPLLVVMAAGYGVAGLPAAASTSSLTKPAGQRPDQLATAALGAVFRLAALAGHPIAAPGAPARGSSGGGSPVLIVAIFVAACVAAAGGVIALRRRAATR